MKGVAGVTDVKQTVSIPVIGIGGINSGNVRDVMLAGADGVAVISGILSAPDLKQAATEMIRLIADGRKQQYGEDT
jgi:thiamine-phosphate pyrophosphorylase